MIFKTNAIVLRQHPLRDADRLYYLLAPRDGKLKVLSRGAGKISSKMSGQMQPFSTVRVMIGRGKQDHLAGADMLISRKELRSDLLSITLASAIAEIIVRLQVPGQEAQREFLLTEQALHLISDEHLDLRDKLNVVFITLWRLLAAAGWKPHFNSCYRCGKSLTEAIWSGENGLICLEHNADGLKITNDILNYLANILSSESWQNLIEQGRSLPSFELWQQFSRAYYQQIAERPFYALTMLNFI